MFISRFNGNFNCRFSMWIFQTLPETKKPHSVVQIRFKNLRDYTKFKWGFKDGFPWLVTESSLRLKSVYLHYSLRENGLWRCLALTTFTKQRKKLVRPTHLLDSYSNWSSNFRTFFLIMPIFFVSMNTVFSWAENKYVTSFFFLKVLPFLVL